MSNRASRSSSTNNNTSILRAGLLLKDFRQASVEAIVADCEVGETGREPRGRVGLWGSPEPPLLGPAAPQDGLVEGSRCH